MTPSDIEAVLRFAFGECEAMGCPLDDQQRQVLQRVLRGVLVNLQASSLTGSTRDLTLERPNPLAELTPEQRQILLEFIQTQKHQDGDWKAQLLNDWLHDRDSGAIQFIREEFGLSWLERVQSVHIAQYADEMAMTLKVGDRIEVSNGLWEWVQEEGPCSREWFPCTVIGITEISEPSAEISGYSRYTTSTIRFDNGMEYEIQGIYEWNRYSWRWLESS
ncbi:MAG: hypothetical protein HC769_23520 [Cyanobacteria bacterium CRU_2_1]|nr:hypothetical protein [Cyanobacteria bacterium RU_5_0]NJR61539.1 hypothetical protein [Cyanobacteria bacterium CRU_2_1]